MDDETTQPLTAEQVVDKRIAAILAEMDHAGAMQGWVRDYDGPLQCWVQIKAMIDRDRPAAALISPATS